MLLRGGDSAEVMALLAYLNASKALSPLVWIPDEPSCAKEISGVYSHVGTGYAVGVMDTAEVAEEKEKMYASVAPIGKAVVLVEG